MELEDVAEKARRNLMVVSTGILAVWALGIPLDGKLVGAVDLSAVEPWRAWLAATCVLVYFAARYYFAPGTVKEWSSWSGRRKKSVNSELEHSFSRIFKYVPEATAHEVDIYWLDLRHEGNATYNLETPTIYKRRGSFYYSWYRLSPLVDVEHVREPPTSAPPYGEQMQGEYVFTHRYYIGCHWRAFRSAYKPSWELLELSFPWFLALGAAIVCVCKLVTSLIYYSFPFVRQLVLT